MQPKSILAVAIVCVAVLPSSSVAQTADPWLASWKLNVAKSSFNPGPGPTRGGTVTFEAWGEDGMQRTNPDPKGTTYGGSYDGKDYPIKNNPRVNTISFRRLNAYSYEMTWKLNGEVRSVSRGSVSSDGKTRHVIAVGKNAKGEDFANYEWFDRQ